MHEVHHIYKVFHIHEILYNNKHSGRYNLIYYSTRGINHRYIFVENVDQSGNHKRNFYQVLEYSKYTIVHETLLRYIFYSDFKGLY